MSQPFDQLIAELRTSTNQTDSKVLKRSTEALRQILDTAGREPVDAETQKP
jgi:hypothetical protein